MSTFRITTEEAAGGRVLVIEMHEANRSARLLVHPHLVVSVNQMSPTNQQLKLGGSIGSKNVGMGVTMQRKSDLCNTLVAIALTANVSEVGAANQVVFRPDKKEDHLTLRWRFRRGNVIVMGFDYVLPISEAEPLLAEALLAHSRGEGADLFAAMGMTIHMVWDPEWVQDARYLI